MEQVYITDKQGNKVLPITHVDAVRDDEGNTLSSIMGDFEDEVRGLLLNPIELSSLSHDYTFKQNDCIMVGSVLYKCTVASTTKPPFNFVFDANNKIVVDRINGVDSVVCDSTTLNTGWEVLLDLSDRYYIEQRLLSKADKATTLAGYGITDAYTKTQVNTSLSTKQNTLEFESSPTKNSTKMLNSGALYRTFNKAAAWDFDSEATNVITPGLIRKITDSTSSSITVYIDRSQDDSSVCRYGLLVKSLKQDVNTVQVSFYIRDSKYSHQATLSKSINAKGNTTTPYNYFEISLIGLGYLVEDKGNIYFDYDR